MKSPITITYYRSANGFFFGVCVDISFSGLTLISCPLEILSLSEAIWAKIGQTKSWKKVKHFSKIGKVFQLRTKETFNERFY